MNDPQTTYLTQGTPRLGYFSHLHNTILEGRDCMVIKPSGSGKSLCYQFPPIYQNKMSLVLTPTISLMKDQVTNCTEKGIHTGVPSNSCCGVCAQECIGSNDLTEELTILHDAINTIC